METTLPVEYTYDGSNWKTLKITTTYRTVNDRKIPIKTFEPVTVETIPVNGNGVWYVSEGGSAKISL